MNINVKLSKNFVTGFNKMQEAYGEELAKVNGFADTQLSYTDFIDQFVDKDTVADETIFQDIENLSDYRIRVPEGLQLTRNASEQNFHKNGNNQNKGKSNQRHKNGRNWKQRK